MRIAPPVLSAEVPFAVPLTRRVAVAEVAADAGVAGAAWSMILTWFAFPG
jgi:hypothetical protein